MLRRDARFREAVEAAVTAIEERSDAEIVVVAARRSGAYQDVALWAGLALGFVVLLLVVYAPWDFSATWLPLDLVAAVGLGGWMAHRSDRLLARITPRARQRRQVADAATIAFHEEQVHATRRRTGVLVYVSALEAAVHVIRDHGVDAHVPAAEWNRLRWEANDLDGFLAGLAAAGDLLARHVPAIASDNPDEIPNAPRIRS